MKIKASIVLMIILSLGFTGCRIGQKVRRPDPVQTNVLAANYLFDKISDNRFEFDQMQIKFDLKMKKDQGGQNFGGTIRMKKDSLIWISITPALGIEVVRLLVTPDSVKLIDKIHKTYTIKHIKDISDLLKIEVDFNILQSLIIGNDLSYYSTDNFKADKEGQAYKLSTVGRSKLKDYIRNDQDRNLLIIQDLWVESESYRLIRNSIKSVKTAGRKLDVDYSEFMVLDSCKLATKIDVKVSADEQLKMKLNIQYSNIVMKEDLKFPFRISKKYEERPF